MGWEPLEKRVCDSLVYVITAILMLIGYLKILTECSFNTYNFKLLFVIKNSKVLYNI